MPSQAGLLTSQQQGFDSFTAEMEGRRAAQLASGLGSSGGMPERATSLTQFSGSMDLDKVLAADSSWRNAPHGFSDSPAVLHEPAAVEVPAADAGQELTENAAKRQRVDDGGI